MSDPTEAFQRGAFAALTGSAALAAITALKDGNTGKPRVLDRVATAQDKYPRITLGEIQVLDDSNGCGRAWEIFLTTHVWSRAVGKPEAQVIGGAASAALCAALDLGDDYVCTEYQFREGRYFADEDGLTTHGVLTHRYLIDPV